MKNTDITIESWARKKAEQDFEQECAKLRKALRESDLHRKTNFTDYTLKVISEDVTETDLRWKETPRQRMLYLFDTDGAAMRTVKDEYVQKRTNEIMAEFIQTFEGLNEQMEDLRNEIYNSQR